MSERYLRGLSVLSKKEGKVAIFREVGPYTVREVVIAEGEVAKEIGNAIASTIKIFGAALALAIFIALIRECCGGVGR